MRVTSCRWLFLPPLLLLGGCFLVHGSGDGASDDPAIDAGPVPIDADLTRDAGPGAVDASPSDCRPVDGLVQACVEGDPAADFAPGVVVRVDDCHCGGTLRCDVDATDGTAAIAVSICGEGICRACTPPTEVFCSLPDASTRTIVSGSIPHFELGPAPEDGQLCQTVGSLGGGLCAFPGRAWTEVEEVCIPELPVESGTRLPLVVAGEVSCAFEPGPCEVELDDTTRTIELRPHLRSCDEGSPTWGCIGGSGRLERQCWTPELRDGSYTLQLGGRTLGTLTVGAFAPAGCVALR